MSAFPEIDSFLGTLPKNWFGDAPYRLVFSDDLTENRLSRFRGALFPEIRNVPKYNYISSRWILEKWFPPAPSNEIDVSRGAWEPLWVFEDKKQDPLLPNLKVIQLLIDASEGKLRQPPQETEKEADQREINRMLALIGEE